MCVSHKNYMTDFNAISHNKRWLLKTYTIKIMQFLYQVCPLRTMEWWYTSIRPAWSTLLQKRRRPTFNNGCRWFLPQRTEGAIALNDWKKSRRSEECWDLFGWSKGQVRICRRPIRDASQSGILKMILRSDGVNNY